MGIWDTIKDIGGALLPLAGPIGGVASTLIDASSQRATNAQNQQNIQQQEQFQNTQSSTAYQRATKDMAAAGLNPALAYQQGGASTPQGGASTAQAPFQNTTSKFATALQTYNDLASGVAQRDLLREQTNATQAKALLDQTQTTILKPQAVAGADKPYIEAYLRAQRAKMGQAEAEATNYPTQFGANIRNLNASTGTAQAQAANLRSQTTLNEQGYQNEWFRKNITPYLNSTAAATDAVKNFIPDMRFNTYNHSTYLPRP